MSPNRGHSQVDEFACTVDGPAANIGVFIALKTLRGYKLLISPYFRGSCRFLPSCADYAAEAIRVHGLVRGSWLAALRLLRCQPLCAAGHDPVPPVSALHRGCEALPLWPALRRTAVALGAGRPAGHRPSSQNV